MVSHPSIDSHPHVNQWIELTSDERILIHTGKIDIGQRISTALALIATYLDSIKQWLSNLAGEGFHQIGGYLFTNQDNMMDKIILKAAMDFDDKNNRNGK